MKALKKHLNCIFVFISFFVCTKSYGQIYFSFPQDSARWCIWNYHGSISSSGKRLLSFEFGNDTLIEGMSYKNIIMTERYSATCCDGGGHYFNINIEDTIMGNVGAMRFDGKKVYAYMYLSSVFPIQCPAETDVLLYDFGLQSGDSAYLQSFSDPHYFHITYIDSILLTDGLYHRTLYNDIDGGKMWIEGVGDADKGLYGTYIFDVLGGDNYSVIQDPIFMLNDMILYSKTGGDCDLGGVNAVTDISLFYHIYFDKNHSLIINFPVASGEYQLHVYGITGEKLFSSDVQNQDRIDLSFLSSGFYLAVVELEDRKIYSQKFLSAD